MNIWWLHRSSLRLSCETVLSSQGEVHVKQHNVWLAQKKTLRH